MYPLKYLLPAMALTLASCGGGGDGGGTTNPPGPVALVQVSRSSASLRIAEATAISATAKDANNNTLTGKTFTWAIDPPGVASIAASGSVVQVTGTAVGNATLTATVDGKVGTVAVTVTNTAFPSTGSVTVSNDQFDPNVVDISAGGTVTWTWAAGAADHNVTFTSGPTTVNAISTRNTGSDSRTFATAGTYDYHCTIHTGMQGTIVAH